MSINSSMIMSFYKEIVDYNKEGSIKYVQNIQNQKLYLKKKLSTYDYSIYEELMNSPVPGIPRIMAVQEEDNHLYIIEEYVSGFTIEETLVSNGAMPEKLALYYIRKLCEVLERLHEHKPPIIHRDIKPENVMITSSENIVLLDLNVAKFENREKAADTNLLGTAGYAAPEQYGFASSDVRTDIFGVGMLLKTMLTYKNDKEVQFSKKVDSLINKCTQLNPDDRYSNISSVLKALRRL